MSPASVNIACEGETDRAVARRLLNHFGIELGAEFPAGSKTRLDPKLRPYLSASQMGGSAWLILRDLDRDAECPPTFLMERLPKPHPPLFHFRMAVRAIETWLMADRRGLATFLGCAEKHILARPEEAFDPKRAMVDIARHSKSNRVKKMICPPPRGGCAVGPEYTSAMIEFARDVWDVRRAIDSGASPSLARCARRLEELAADAG